MIQICVDKQGGLQTFNNTIFVEVVGNKLPHLSNFSGQSLSFPWGTTQACFNLTLGSDQSSLAYTLGIRGATEELEVDVIHKVTGICGVITKPVNTPSPTSSAAPVDFWDRFGNAYAYEELLFNSGGMECMDSGDFALEFSGNFSPDEITTICSLFNYLSTLIETTATDIPILILKETLTGSTLAAATNTDLIVDDNSFTNMQAGVPAYPTLNYRGVGLVTERIDAGLYSTVVLDSEFDQCRIGISSRFCSLKVYGNDMDNVTTGIAANLPNMGPVAIGAAGTSGNLINASENGILAAGFSFNSAVYIENNQITLGASTGRRGIRLALTQSDDANVRNNIIALAGTGHGMEFVGVENTHITNNTVNLLNSPLATVGISLRGAEHILLQGNTVTGSALTGDDDKNIAIDIFSSPDIGYCCNTLDDTRIGVRVRGSSLSTDQFRGTTFGDHATGLRIEENSVLGSQSHTENSWTGTTYINGFGAVYDVPLLTADQFPFVVDPTTPNGNPSFFTANQPTNWFEANENPNSGTFDYCNLTQCSLENFFGPGTDDEYFIAGGSNLNPFTPAVAWQAQKYAYERYNSNNLAYNSGMSSYVQTMNNNNIGAHSNYKGQVKSCFLLNTSDRTAVDNHYSTKETELTTLSDWEAQFVQSGATALSTQSQADRANLLGTAWQTSQTGAALGSGIITSQESTASTLLSVDLPSTASYTTNSELTLQLQLSTALRPWIGLSATNLQALETTAAECALTDGNGVFQAQGLLAFLDDPETSYDDSACDKGQALQKAEGDNVASQPLDKQRFQLEQQFKASPNPSSQRQITVQVPNIDQAAELQLSNLQGQTLKRWSLNKDQQQILISLEDIPDGLFLLRWSDGEINLTTKLILQ